MRQTLNGWLWFVLGCLFLWPSFSFAGSAGKPPACEMYKAIAEEVMRFRDSGYLQENVVALINSNQEPHVIDNMKTIIKQGYAWPKGRKDFKDWIYQMCKAKGWQSQAYVEMHLAAFRMAASSQKLYCENRLPFAEMVARDFAAGLTVDQVGAISEADQRTIKDVAWCLKAGEPLRACVVRRCMGENASNEDGRERFRQAVRESLQRNTEIFKRAHAGPIR